MSSGVQQTTSTATTTTQNGISKEQRVRENHNEIERRRRNKMAQYVSELSDILIKKKVLTKRPDKLSVLQCAANQMREYSEKSFKKLFLKSEELRYLIDDAAKGFSFVVDCSSGLVLKNLRAAEVLQAGNWTGTSIYDQIHPEDHRLISEQLSLDIKPHYFDLKNGTVRKEDNVPHYREAIRLKRNFKCRMRHGQYKYAIVSCNGHILNVSSDVNQDRNCLIAFGKLSTYKINARKQSTEDSVEAVIDVNGIITNASGKLLNVMGYETKQVNGLSFLQFVHPHDMQKFTNYFKYLIQNKGKEFPLTYRLQSVSGECVWVNCEGEAIINPSSEKIEFIICKHSRYIQTNHQLSTIRNPTAVYQQQNNSNQSHAMGVNQQYIQQNRASDPNQYAVQPMQHYYTHNTQYPIQHQHPMQPHGYPGVSQQFAQNSEAQTLYPAQQQNQYVNHNMGQIYQQNYNYLQQPVSSNNYNYHYQYGHTQPQYDPSQLQISNAQTVTCSQQTSVFPPAASSNQNVAHNCNVNQDAADLNYVEELFHNYLQNESLEDLKNLFDI